MRHRLEILKPDAPEGGFGDAVATRFTAVGTVWAERVKMTGRRIAEAGEMFPDYSVRWNIRDAHTVSEGWRVRHLGGHLYTVNNIIPNADRGMLTLECERVNL